MSTFENTSCLARQVGKYTLRESTSPTRLFPCREAVETLLVLWNAQCLVRFPGIYDALHVVYHGVSLGGPVACGKSKNIQVAELLFTLKHHQVSKTTMCSSFRLGYAD